MKEYTPEDVRRMCGDNGPLEHEYTDAFVADLLNAAVKAERERILSILEESDIGSAERMMLIGEISSRGVKEG